MLSEQARPQGGKYVLPIQIHNRGDRTLSSLKLQVSCKSVGGVTTEGDILIDYLGEGASTTVYVYVEQHPRELQIRVQPFAYQLE